MTGQLLFAPFGASTFEPWVLSHRFDKRALPLADRHYNRRKVGSPQFVPPGRCVVLLTPEADALWVTSWPFGQYVRHAWPGAWVNSLFRNESPRLSSDLIVSAIRATGTIWDLPPQGVVSFVDASKTRRKRDPGRCYLRAGWERCGTTKGGLYALHLLPPGGACHRSEHVFSRGLVEDALKAPTDAMSVHDPSTDDRIE